MAAVIVLAGALGTRTTDDFSLPGTGSQKAADVLDRHFPALNDLTSPVVFASRDGARLDRGANKRAVEAVVARLKRTGDVASVTDPFTPATLSKDGRIAYTTLTFSLSPQDLTRDAADAIVDAAQVAQRRRPGRGRRHRRPAGRRAGRRPRGGHRAGDRARSCCCSPSARSSPPGMPILTALIGLGAGLSLVTVLSNVITVPTIGPTLGTMIGLGVGIDYALFLITRHRQHLAAGMSVAESIPLTVATSGNAVVFAGGTVVIALCSLALAGIPIVASLGYSAAIVVVIAVLTSITLLPALLALLGTRINALKVPGLHRRASRPGAHGWARWAEMIARRPWPWLVLGVAVLLALTVPLLSLRLGQDDNSTAAQGSGPRVAFDLLAKGFGPGFNGPLLVVVPGAPDQAALAKVGTALGARARHRGRGAGAARARRQGGGDQRDADDRAGRAGDRDARQPAARRRAARRPA